MGIGPPKTRMNIPPTSHRNNFYIGGYCILKEHRQPQHGWTWIYPLVQPGERTIIHKVENHDHQRPSKSWVND